MESNNSMDLQWWKAVMMNVSDYNKNAQKAVSHGMETFFNWQKQALENTLTMVEEGIAVQEKNLNETRKQYQD